MLNVKSIFILHIVCSLVRVRAWKVTVCTHPGFQGTCANLQGEGCMNANLFDDDTIMNDRINSINTHGGCVRAFGDANCVGLSRAYYVGSPEPIQHSDLSQSKFGNIISSFGPCYPYECARYGGKVTDNCVFHDLIYFGTRKSDQVTSTDVRESGNPIIKYSRGPKNRVEYVRAIIQRNHLDTGTDPSEDVKNYIRTMGQPNDEVGYVIPKILGGTGTQTYNVFPQNAKVKQGLIYKTVDKMAYDVVKQQSYVEMEVSLHYEFDNSTRPSVILYRFHGDKFYSMKDLINPL